MLSFRFDKETHTYTALDTGARMPHITGMLERAGWIDDTWWTEDARIRGTAVHELTAEYDLGALDLSTLVSAYRGWVLGHAKAMAIMRPVFQHIEEPMAHPVYRFGGTIDRVLLAYCLQTVVDIKSGAKTLAHQIQTALQAILVSACKELPAELWARYTEYLDEHGKFSIEPHADRRDFDEAYRIIRMCC